MKTKIIMQVLSAALIIQIAFLPDFANAQADTENHAGSL